MKGWNTTAWIKSSIIALPVGFNILVPPSIVEFSIIPLLRPFVIGLVLVWFSAYLTHRFFGFKIESPDWNDNPIYLNRPLRFFQFLSYYNIFMGASILIGSMVAFSALNNYGLSFICWGLGIRFGISLSLRIRNLS